MAPFGSVLALAVGAFHSQIERDDPSSLTDAEYLVYLLSSMGLVVMAGLMSGLTLGLMSLDEVEMEILVKSGKSNERKHAEKIRSII